MGDDAMIAGVGAQRVKSCLNILDISCQLKEPVVCSYVISDSSRKAGDLGDTLQQLARIFGMKIRINYIFMHVSTKNFIFKFECNVNDNSKLKMT